MSALLWVGLAACLSVGRWDEPPSLRDAAGIWYSGSVRNASLGTHVEVMGDVDGDGSADLALAEFGEYRGGADRVYIVDGGDHGSVVAGDVALVELVGVDSRREVAPSFAYARHGDSAILGTLAWGSPETDDGPGVVFLVSGEDLAPSPPKGGTEEPAPKVVDVTVGPRLRGAVEASRFGAVVVAADLVPGGAWELAIGAPGSPEVPGAVWLVVDPPLTGSPSIADWPSAIELASSEPVSISFGASIALVANGTPALFTTRVSSDAADATVHGWLDPAGLGDSATISAADSDLTVLAPELVRRDARALQVIGDLDGDGRDDLAIREQNRWSIVGGVDEDMPTHTDRFPLHLALPWTASTNGYDCRGLVALPHPAGPHPAGGLDLAVGDCPVPGDKATVYVLGDAADLAGEVVPAVRATRAFSGRSPQSGGVLAAYPRTTDADPFLVVGDYADDLTEAGEDRGSVFIIGLTENVENP